MITKINNSSNLYGAIVYNYQKVKEGKGTVLATNRVLRDFSPEQDLHVQYAIWSFEPYLIANQRTAKPIAHMSLNPDPKDELTDDQYIELAEDYLEKMNFADQPYIIYKHEDTDRTHLHIVTTRLDETGKKKVSDSHEWIRNKKVCRQLEQKYGLTPMIEDATSQRIHIPKRVDYKKGDIKNQIYHNLQYILKNYKFQTFGEYNALLSCYYIHAKQVKGEESTNAYKGMVYSAMNKEGEIVGLPIKSSRMGKAVGYEAIEKQMKKHTDDFRKIKVPVKTKAIIVHAIKNNKTLSAFRKELNKSHIDVVFRINDEGRIYGVTFIDHLRGLVYNGSRLGKEFSANTFHALYQEKNHPSISSSIDTVNTLTPDSDKTETLVSTDVDEIFGTFYLNYHGEDLEYEFRKKNKKKKRQIRR